MNEKVLRHKEICDGLNELYARKNHDYGDSFHTTFVEEGLAIIFVLPTLKWSFVSTSTTKFYTIS